MSGHRLHNVKTDKLTVIKFLEWKEKIFNLEGKIEILTTLKKHQRKEQNQNYV